MNWNPKQTESDDTYAWIGAAVIFAVLGVVGAFLAGVLSASAAGALLALITTGVLLSTRGAQADIAEDIVDSIVPNPAPAEQRPRKAA